MRGGSAMRVRVKQLRLQDKYVETRRYFFPAYFFPITLEDSIPAEESWAAFGVDFVHS